MPKLSIITVNYNNVLGLQRTIESVANQNYDDLEYIIVDGGSTDGSVDIIKQNENRIVAWISEKDNGVYHAMNKGIKMATGEYLLFLNSGDRFFDSSVLTENKSHFRNEDLICFNIKVIGNNIDFIKKHPTNLHFSYLFAKTLAHQSVLIKRKLFERVGLYDESLKIVADWKFFIHVVALHNASYKSVHKTLSVYYLDGVSATGEGTNMRKQERKKVLREDFGIFYNDYLRLQKLDSNRFKMLTELENSKLAKKINSLMLRILLKLFRNKRLKEL